MISSDKTCRESPNGKLLIKPSKKNVKTFPGRTVRKTIKAALGMSAADLIDQLDPKIRGWPTIIGTWSANARSNALTTLLFSSLWRWARRRHPNKRPRWFKTKYFDRRRGMGTEHYFGETCDDEGRPTKVWLYYTMSTPHQTTRQG